MKKRLLSFGTCMALAFTSFAQQIPNAGFENWNNTAGYQNPDGWDNSNSVMGSMGTYTVTKGTPGNPGASYIKLTTKTDMGISIPGIAVSGHLDASNPAAPKYSGFAFNTRPTALTGNWQYMAMSNDDKGAILVLLSKWNNSTMSRDTVGVASEILNGMVMSWENFSIPITYMSQDMPDSAIIVLASSGAGTAITANSYLYVDNLKFEIMNAGIQNTNIVRNLKVYPIPANNTLTITFNNEGKTKNISLSLCDIQGRILLQQDNIQNKITLDIRSLATGNYFLKLSDGSAIQTQQIIIKK